MNPAHWLVRAARSRPDAPALLAGTEVTRTYGAFADAAARIATGFRERHGVGPGDRVVFFMGNRTEYLETFYGALFVGAVVVPVNYKLHGKEAAWIVADAEAKLVVADEDSAERISPHLAGTQVLVVDSADYVGVLGNRPSTAPVSRAAEDLAWLFYTSGTTGRPKGVMLSYRNIEALCFGYLADVDDVRPSDAILYAAPVSHGAGLYNFVHILRGARHVFPTSGGFDAAEVLDLAARLHDVSMFAAPAMVMRLVDEALASGADGDGLKTVVYGGGPMYRADIERAVEVLGDRFVQIYGQGESPMTITALPRARVSDRTSPGWRERLGSVGTAHACCEVAVLDGSGDPLPVGESGEVAVRGSPVMSGYWRNPEATAEALRNGWLRTGDIGSLDADGYLTLSDRSKDVIISGGTNIYPREVEEALLLHPSVREVSVIGRPCAEWGEDVVAFVVLRDGHARDAAALDRHCLGEMARFKRPKEYVFVDNLPKSHYGKILKTELRSVLNHRVPSPATP